MFYCYRNKINKSLFKQRLIDRNIGWFAYVKFYLDKIIDESKPLVVGKTGSMLKNINGTDVSFSTEINDGPARKFLEETNQQWDKTQILVIPYDSGDEEDLKIEKSLQNKFSLFVS